MNDDTGLAGWEYADYILETGARKRTFKLRQHILEVSNAIKNGYLSRSGADGWSISKSSLELYLKTLKEELAELAPVVRPTTAFIGLR